MKLHLVNNQLFEGDQARFKCDSSIKTPNVYRCELGRSNVMLSRRNSPGEFILRKITRHDAGRYWCRCENYLGSSTDQARLDVKSKVAGGRPGCQSSPMLVLQTLTHGSLFIGMENGSFKCIFASFCFWYFCWERTTC